MFPPSMNLVWFGWIMVGTNSSRHWVKILAVIMCTPPRKVINLQLPIFNLPLDLGIEMISPFPIVSSMNSFSKMVGGFLGCESYLVHCVLEDFCQNSIIVRVFFPLGRDVMALVSSCKVMGLIKSIYMHETTLNGTFHQYSTQAMIISSSSASNLYWRAS